MPGATNTRFTLPYCSDGLHWVDSEAILLESGEVQCCGRSLSPSGCMPILYGDDAERRDVILFNGDLPLKSCDECLSLPFPLDARMPGLPWCMALRDGQGREGISSANLMSALARTPRVPLCPARREEALRRSANSLASAIGGGAADSSAPSVAVRIGRRRAERAGHDEDGLISASPPDEEEEDDEEGEDEEEPRIADEEDAHECEEDINDHDEEVDEEDEEEDESGDDDFEADEDEEPPPEDEEVDDVAPVPARLAARLGPSLEHRPTLK